MSDLNLIDALNRDGYFIARQFFSKDKVHRIQLDAKKVFSLQFARMGYPTVDIDDERAFSQNMFRFFKEDMAGFTSAGKACQHLISMHRLSLDEQIMQMLNDAGLRFPNISTRPVMFFNSDKLAVSQGYWKTPPHQDWRSIQGSLNCLVVWVPLMSINIELGALEFAGGTHRLGLLNSKEDDFFRTVQPDLFKDFNFKPIETYIGDVLVFSAFLVHRSGHNSTDHIRWSCHFRYNDLQEQTFIDRKFPNPYSYRPQQELITPDFPEAKDLQTLFKSP